MTRKVIEIRLKPRVNFYDKMYSIGDELMTDFPDWLTDRMNLSLFNKEKKFAVYLEFNRLAIVTENYDPNDNSFDKIVNKTISIYMSNLPVTEIVRLGIRVTKLVKLKFKYNEYVSIFQKKFYPSPERFKGLLPSTLNDVVFSADFVDDNKFHYLLGPATKDEAKQRFEAKFPVEDKELAENMLFVDIDGFDDNFKISKLDSKLESIDEKVMTLLENSISFATS